MLTLAASCCLTLPPPVRVQPEREPTGLAWFRRADENSDGFISFDEFPNRRMFLAFDRDADNLLSMEELARAIGDRASRRGEGIEGVEMRLDVSYLDDESEDDKPENENAGDEEPEPAHDPRLTSLDLYIPSNLEPEELRPIIAYVHGGAWRIGDKSRVHSKPKHYCQKGYIFASINYRLSPDVKHPAHAEDVASAVAWLHENAEQFGADPERIVLMGHSAGAHLVSLVATNPSHLGAHNLAPSDLQGVIALDTALFNLTERADDRDVRDMIKEAIGESAETLADASPTHHLRSGRTYPPFLIVYASRRLVAKTEAERFADALSKVGADGRVFRAERKGHAGVNADASLEGDPLCEAIDAFIGRICSDRAGQQSL